MVDKASSDTASCAGSLVVVLQPHDVIFPEIVAQLDLDEDQRPRAGIPDAMGRPDGDVDALANVQVAQGAVEGHPRGPRDHRPVLGAPSVRLVAQAMAGRDLDALDL